MTTNSTRSMLKTTCPACGAAASRSGTCNVCGKLLSEGFQPLDAIRSSYGMQGKTLIENEPQHLFEPEKKLSSDTAWACNVYSAVPYLGILFVPFALGFGGIGFIRAQQQPRDRRLAAQAIVVSILILGVQIFLWWLLYIVPRLHI